MPEEVKAKKQGGHEWCGCCSCLAALGVIPALLIAIAFLAIFSFVQPFFNLVSCPVGILSHFARTQNTWLSLINQNLNVYKAAAQATNVPWEALAAIHYREANLRPNYSLGSGEKVGTINPDQGIVIGNTSLETAIWAGRHLQGKVGNLLTQDTVDENLLGKAFLRYNRGSGYGYGGENYMAHPYTMNNYNSDHINMHWPSGDPLKGTETRDGALTIFGLLKNAIINPNGSITSAGGCLTYSPE